MKITYIGQAGFLVEAEGLKIIIDPYLSNSVVAVNPKNYRRQPINESYLALKPDVIVCTHDHLDHTDPDTLVHYLGDEADPLVLAPYSAWNHIRQFGRGGNHVMFNAGTTWNEGKVKFRAVKAEHSDREAIGLVLEAEGRTLYFTGDTLYNEEVLKTAPRSPDALFLPINGVGNNMNATDAMAFAEVVDAKNTVPCHVGMFDNIDPHCFVKEGAIYPEIYKEIVLK